MNRAMWLTPIALLLSCVSLRADNALPQRLQTVGLDQRLGQHVPLELTFRDENGDSVRLADLIHGRPAILVLAYFRCPMLCTQVLNGLVDGLRPLSLTAGQDYDVVVVSFDPREGPPLATAKKASYVESYGRTGAEAGWHFLTGRQDAIDRLTASVGFHFFYDTEKEQFAHASGVVLLTSLGRIARVFYGINFAPRDLRLGLVEASAGTIGSPVDQLLLLCFHYDATTGQYTPVVMGFVRLGGALTLLLLVPFLVRAWRRRERCSRN